MGDWFNPQLLTIGNSEAAKALRFHRVQIARLESLALASLGIVLGLEIASVGWTIAGNFYDYGVGISLGEMIISSWLRVHAPRRKRLQRRRIKMIAVAEVPLTRDDSRHPVVAV